MLTSDAGIIDNVVAPCGMSCGSCNHVACVARIFFVVAWRECLGRSTVDGTLQPLIFNHAYSRRSHGGRDNRPQVALPNARPVSATVRLAPTIALAINRRCSRSGRLQVMHAPLIKIASHTFYCAAPSRKVLSACTGHVSHPIRSAFQVFPQVRTETKPHLRALLPARFACWQMSLTHMPEVSAS